MPKQVPESLEGFDRFGAYVGLSFTRWESGYSQCVLDIEEKLFNPHLSLHGGATFTMADSGMGAALYSLIDDDEMCSTIETKIVYFKAVKSGTLTCDTRVIHRSKRIAALESEISLDGELVAKALGTWSIHKVNRE